MHIAIVQSEHEELLEGEHAKSSSGSAEGLSDQFTVTLTSSDRIQPVVYPSRSYTHIFLGAIMSAFGGQRWDRTADVGLFRPPSKGVSGLKSADMIDTISVMLSSI